VESMRRRHAAADDYNHGAAGCQHDFPGSAPRRRGRF
jgi:hypothetical protein